MCGRVNHPIIFLNVNDDSLGDWGLSNFCCESMKVLNMVGLDLEIWLFFEGNRRSSRSIYLPRCLMESWDCIWFCVYLWAMIFARTGRLLEVMRSSTAFSRSMSAWPTSFSLSSTFIRLVLVGVVGASMSLSRSVSSWPDLVFRWLVTTSTKNSPS